MRRMRWHARMCTALVVGGLAVLAFAQGSGAPAEAVQPHPHGPFGAMLSAFERQPFPLLFLVVAAGYALGQVKVKGLGLGATAATLLVGLALSIWASAAHGLQFKLPDFTSTVFFNLFIFAIGMKVGPQFLAGVHREGRNFLILAVLVPVVAAGMTFAARYIFTLSPGMLPGLLAGATTATPGLGSAQAAITSGESPLPPGVTQEQAVGNLTTAYALTYCLSILLFTVVLKVMPRMFGRDAVADAKSMEKALQGEQQAPLPGTADQFLRGYMPVDVRAYRVEHPALLGRSLGELRQRYPGFSVERVLRGGTVLEPTDALNLQAGDEAAVAFRVSRLVESGERIGPEVDEPQLLDIRFETVELVLKNREVEGHTLGELARKANPGLYLNALFRAGDQLPKEPNLVLRRGDVLRITGSQRRIAELEPRLGTVVRPSLSTDIITLALGLSLGVLLGAITVPIHGIRFSLGSAVGLLIVSIGLSTLRTHNPALGGPFPEASRQLLEDLGLNVFIAILGLNAGTGVVESVASGAVVPILITGTLVGLVPAFIAWAVGQYVLKMNTAVLMGAVAGARCSSPGMRTAQEATHSIVPAIGYAMPFAISNLLLTLLSYVFALLG